MIDGLLEEVRRRENVVLYLSTELVEKEGRVGEFRVQPSDRRRVIRSPSRSVRSSSRPGSTRTPRRRASSGSGSTECVTLPEFKELLANHPGPLVYRGRPVRTIAYVYCVGSREESKETGPHLYCSRYCCSATSHIATVVSARDPSVHQFHLFRDIRTYGKYEALYERALRAGSVFLRYGEDSLPSVTRDGEGLRVSVDDRLMRGEEVEIRADLVVLVTGMVARENDALARVLKLPLGQDGFFHEIHVKLRPGRDRSWTGCSSPGPPRGRRTWRRACTSVLAVGREGGRAAAEGVRRPRPPGREGRPDPLRLVR